MKKILRLKTLILTSFLAFISINLYAQMVGDDFSLEQEKIIERFKIVSNQINDLGLEVLPQKDRGRIKPLDTLARENNLYLTGKSSLFQTKTVGFYLGLILFPETVDLPVINIRTVEVRTLLGFPSKKRYYSLNELEKTKIRELAEEAQKLEKKNKNLLNGLQKGEIEVLNQIFLLRGILSADMFFEALMFTKDGKNDFLIDSGKNLFNSLSSNQGPVVNLTAAKEMLSNAYSASMDESFGNQRSKISLEVIYNKMQIFFMAGLFFFLISILVFLPQSRNILSSNIFTTLALIPTIMMAIGFAIRVYITEFPPVTNMYGTMLWVAFGISIFSLVLYMIYKDKSILGIMSFGAALLLMLTENIPLIISPSMDPIVAVLRSSYWLTIHVLSVTISYGAFSMAMILGNIVVIMSFFKNVEKDVIKRYAHYAYRSIQLGVFLITAGIILGGVWADYSWGRFWGWDPKETWALIADLGFLILLHGRFVGWIDDFRLLVISPIAYLLVVMAWFGVNFILAAGLHSYGFSSGGTAMVVTFVAFQVGLLIAFAIRLMFNAKK